MGRNREVRRAPMVTTNGIPRRRHRPSGLRDSPEDEGALELQETARFRDRSAKKDGDREKKRSGRERLERERDRDRFGRSKRRRGDKHVDSSGGSISDEDEEDPDDAPLRVTLPNPVSVSSSSSPSSALTSNRKSHPPAAKAFEFGFSVPRKARSASTKRFHDCWSSVGVAGESVVLQASPSPVRPSTVAVASPSPAPVSPTSNLSVKKKTKANGPKQRPPNSRAKSPSSVQDDIEIEVAEALYELMTQSQVPPEQEMISNGSAKHDPREVNRSTVDSKSRATSPISNSGSAPLQNPLAIPQNSPLSAVAPKRKRPRPVGQLEEKSDEVHSPMPDKNLASVAGNGGGSFDLVKPHGPHLRMEPAILTPAIGVSTSDDKRSSAVDRLQGKDTETSRTVEEVASPEKESVDVRVNCTAIEPITAAATASETESCREERLEIDLMAPPPQSRSLPERESEMVRHHEHMARDGDVELKSKHSGRVNVGRTDSVDNADMKTVVVDKLLKFSVGGKEGETHKPNLKKARTSDLHLDLDRSVAHSSADDGKLNQQPPLKTFKDDTSTDKTASPLPVPMSVPAGWPTGLPPMGYLAPLQGVVSIDGRAMAAPTTIQPPRFLFSQPRPGKCATHCYVAKNIHSHQQFMKNYPYWPTPAGAAQLFSGKPYNLNAASDAARGGDVHVQDKGPTLSFFPGQQPAASDKVDNAQKKQFYQGFTPPGGPNNVMHGPTPVFFPPGQQQLAAAGGGGGGAASHASSTKSRVGTAASASASTSAMMSFNYPNMPVNEAQYLAILANGAYQFPVPAHVGSAQAYRGPHAQVMPFFNGSYYPSQMLHPSQLQQQQQAQPSRSSSSQKHPQTQPQKPQGSSANAAAPKTPASQTQHPDSAREGSQSNMNIYGQSFTLPFNPASFALMKPPASTSVNANGNHGEKQQQPQAFAMSFAPINGATTPAFDITSMSQNHAFMQSLPEPIRSNYLRMAAQAAQQKKAQEDSKPRASGPSNVDDERKRSSSIPSVSGNNVVDTSQQHSSHPPASNSTSNASFQQQRHLLQLQMQQRSKAQVTSNWSGSQQQHMMQQLQMQRRQRDHLSSTSAVVAKLPNGKKRFSP